MCNCHLWRPAVAAATITDRFQTDLKLRYKWFKTLTFVLPQTIKRAIMIAFLFHQVQSSESKIHTAVKPQ